MEVYQKLKLLNKYISVLNTEVFNKFQNKISKFSYWQLLEKIPGCVHGQK
jgi:hypothetical protein